MNAIEIPPADFINFASSAAQLQQNVSSSHDALREINARHVIACAADEPLTEDSFPEVGSATHALAVHLHLRDDAAAVLKSYADLLSALAQNLPGGAIHASVLQLQSDVTMLVSDAKEVVAAGDSDPALASTADLASTAAGLRGLSGSDVDAKVNANVSRAEKVIGILGLKYHFLTDGSSMLALRVLSTAVDEVLRFIEVRHHDKAVRTLLQTTQPDLEVIAGLLVRTNDVLKTARQSMISVLLARANAARLPYNSSARLDSDYVMSKLLSRNRMLAPLIDSVGTAAGHFPNAHSELLQVTEKSRGMKQALKELSDEVSRGYRFYRGVELSELGLMHLPPQV